MAKTAIGIRGVLRAAGFGLALIATPALAAPGDPLGGGHAGCAPADGAGLGCGRKIDALLAKLRLRLVSCHLRQASQAFSLGTANPGANAAEEQCATGPGRSAKTKFDDAVATLAAKGCPPDLIANANARRDIILGDQSVAGSVDNLNGTFYCDATSGELINPGGDEAGYIPSTSDHLKCGGRVAKAWGGLQNALAKCHYKLAAAVFKGDTFDSAACETTGDRSASGRYLKKVFRAIDAGLCPPCLADTMMSTNAVDLGASAIADADADLGEIYLCPAP